MKTSRRVFLVFTVGLALLPAICFAQKLAPSSVVSSFGPIKYGPVRTILLKPGAFLTGLPPRPVVEPIPRIVKKDGRYALFVNGAPYLILGTQVNNSSAWPAMLPKVWPAIEAIYANTVEIPVYWEQFNPRFAQYDFTLVNTLLNQARQHHVHLILLWFGTWKNGSGHYMPLWMKLSPKRFPRMTGMNGKPVDSPSPFATDALREDEQAFQALMRLLKVFDPQRTVIMVQVENEPGTWGSVRDYSPHAQKLFNSPVPASVLTAMQAPVGTPNTNWQSVFGPEAEEYFHAWAVASYVGQVAAAGKTRYDLPMYVNVALRDPIHPGPPGSYESGGATDNAIPIWKAAAPAIDILSPDIYMGDSTRYEKVLDLYGRPDNPLFIPETGSGPSYARFFFSALGHGAIGWSPFGIDFTNARRAPYTSQSVQDWLGPFAMNYQLIGQMDRTIARLNFEGRLQAVSEEPGEPTQSLTFADWTATISYGVPGFGNAAPQGNPTPVGRALIAQLGKDQFLVAGFYCRVDFKPNDPSMQRQFLRVEEGSYGGNEQFNPIRIWNGDQTDWGLNFSYEPQVLRVMLGTY